uniref:SWIM-type domain-containing protein n=1 Tax=Physcomitrium patens TaxID=3218 RepID=A0A7I3ZPI4_PHYPA
MFYAATLNYMWNECRREDYIIQEESDRTCSCAGFFHGLHHCRHGVVGPEETQATKSSDPSSEDGVSGQATWQRLLRRPILGPTLSSHTASSESISWTQLNQPSDSRNQESLAPGPPKCGF